MLEVRRVVTSGKALTGSEHKEAGNVLWFDLDGLLCKNLSCILNILLYYIYDNLHILKNSNAKHLDKQLRK